jgi:predicted nuclease of predicted toxin-antitoxin system
MKILLDEQLSGLEEFLQSLGYDVTTVQDEKMMGAPDYKIVTFAKENNLILVTQDSKQAQIAELQQVKNVWLSFSKLAEITHRELQKIAKSE